MIEKMERETGIEPATSSLGSWHSTAELLPLTRARSCEFVITRLERFVPQPLAVGLVGNLAFPRSVCKPSKAFDLLRTHLRKSSLESRRSIHQRC
jgi:hypothetical protein